MRTLTIAGGLTTAAVVGTLGHVWVAHRYDAVERWEAGDRGRDAKHRVDLARNASDGIGVAAFWGIAIGCIGAAKAYNAPNPSTALLGGALVGLGAAPILIAATTRKPESGIWDHSY